MTVRYEWDVELVCACDTEDHEQGEVLEHHHQEKFKDAWNLFNTPPYEDNTKWELVLVRDDDEGRSWCYFDDGPKPYLTEFFYDAEAKRVAKVPKRFLEEVAKVYAAN